MTNAEIAEYQAFYRLEPWGESWRQTGTVAAMVARQAGAKDIKAEDFLPVQPPDEPLAEEILAAKLKLLLG